MKTLLVPVDLSEVSKNALEYSVHFANNIGGKIICLHAFEFEESGMESIGIARDKVMEKLKMFLGQVETFGVPVELDPYPGSLIEAVESTTKNKKVDLVVMGTKGALGFRGLFTNSNTEEVMHRLSKPILVLPEAYDFNGIKRILFCSDLKPLKDEALAPIKELGLVFDAAVTIAHVQTNLENTDITDDELKKEQAYLGTQIKQRVRTVEHSNISEGIGYFLSYEPSDLIVMIKREHSFLDTLFGVDHTEEVVEDPITPVLVIPE